MFVCVRAIRLTPCVFCVQFPGGDDYASDDDDENAGPSSPKPKTGGGLFGGGKKKAEGEKPKPKKSRKVPTDPLVICKSKLNPQPVRLIQLESHAWAIRMTLRRVLCIGPRAGPARHQRHRPHRAHRGGVDQHGTHGAVHSCDRGGLERGRNSDRQRGARRDEPDLHAGTRGQAGGEG